MNAPAPVRSPALARVEAGRLCSGCGLCRSIAEPGKIDIALTKDGYLRPVQRAALSAREEQLVASTCPGLVIEQPAGDGPIDRLWGPIARSGTGYATDEDLRHHASSGGALSAVLRYLVETKRVDGVIQTAASRTSPIQNATVVSRTAAQIHDSAGSRYAPSSPLGLLREQLQEPGRFAFVGKPCDVAALRAYMRRDPSLADRIPYLIAFFCAGIPSVNGTRKVLARLGTEEREVAAFRFRGDGWPGYATAITHDGRTLRMSYAQSWGEVLSGHVQFRCKICPDGSGGSADIVCADAWYGDADGYPSFEEAAGRSLILARTRAGEELLRQAETAGYVAVENVDPSEIVKMQPYQARRKRLVLSRLAALLVAGRPIPRYRGLHLARLAPGAGLLANLRSFAGLVRRIVQGRLDG